MKILLAKVAVDKGWTFFLKKKKKHDSLAKHAIEETHKYGRTVHFAALEGLCHLTNSELDNKFPTYKGRVVLRVDAEKDDLGSFERFNFATARLRGRSQRCCVRIHSGKHGRCSKHVENTGEAECQVSWIRQPHCRSPKSWKNIPDHVVPLQKNLHGHPFAGLL